MNDTIFEKRISYIISKHEQKKILPKDVLHNTAEQNSLTIKGGTYLYQIFQKSTSNHSNLNAHENCIDLTSS